MMAGKLSAFTTALAWLGILVILGLVVAVFSLPTLTNPPEAGWRTQCANNLGQIAGAMQNYHDVYHCYPPAYTVDQNGRPMHSWRVLILPFLREKTVCEGYRLDEPWDSEQNRWATAKMPDIFRCPSDKKAADGETNYVMIVGPGTVSTGPTSCKWQDIRDGASQTLLVVEVVDSGIHWAEPRDLNFEKMNFRINAPGGNGISSRHSSGANVVLCDTSTHYLYPSIDPAVVKAMVTIAGGEELSWGESRMGESGINLTEHRKPSPPTAAASPSGDGGSEP